MAGMIRMTGEDGEGPVDLLGQDGCGHLMRKRHGAEGEEQAGSFAGGVGEAVGGSDAEDELLLAAMLQRAEMFGELNRA